MDEAAFETRAELAHTKEFRKRVDRLLEAPLEVTRTEKIGERKHRQNVKREDGDVLGFQHVLQLADLGLHGASTGGRRSWGSAGRTGGTVAGRAGS